MQPAPMTPDTLKLIRANADRMPAQQLAEQLGWTVERLQRTARDRCIALVAVVIACPQPQPITPKPKPRLEGTPDEALEFLARSLSHQRRNVLEILTQTRRDRPGRFITSEDIIAALGVDWSRQSIPKVIRDIRAGISCFEACPWAIESEKRKGFRLALIDVAKPLPAVRRDSEIIRTGIQSGRNIEIGGHMTLAEIAAVLPKRQAQVLRSLSKLMGSTSSFITGAELVRIINDGIDLISISGIARSVESRLRATRWRVETANGKHGGYRIGERV